MNGGGAGGGGSVRRKFGGPPPANRLKDRDEDLLLFREMHKREKDRVVSLLQPVSDDFEPTGNYALYRMASAKKGAGVEFLPESEKNDYDWLKTPPATPLFPSLEMEANAPELVVQREIPIMQPLSRFAGNLEAAKALGEKTKPPNAKPKVPLRSVTPSGRPSVLSTSAYTEKKNSKCAPILPILKMNQLGCTTTSTTTTIEHPIKKSSVAAFKPMNEKAIHLNFLASNLTKSLQGTESAKAKPRSRGVSPSVRTKVPAQISGFSNETPPNLKTDRSTSASRGRPAGTQNQQVSKPEPSTMKDRRQSCSPSVTRGRKVAPKQETGEDNSTNMVNNQMGRAVQVGNGAQVFGSRMVDKFMNARKFNAEERGIKPSNILHGSINESSSGFGRMISKSSLDMAVKHMEINSRDPVHYRQLESSTRRKSSIK